VSAQGYVPNVENHFFHCQVYLSSFYEFDGQIRTSDIYLYQNNKVCVDIHESLIHNLPLYYCVSIFLLLV
jgi:hypothetical protein